MKKIMGLFLLIFSISILGCNIFNPTDNSPQVYPTIITPLSEQELEILQREFRATNNFLMCSRLDRYGLVDREGFCAIENPNIPIEEREVIELSKLTLYKNRKFTNVKDTTGLAIGRIFMMTPNRDNTHWRIDYLQQQYNGHKILDTEIVLWAHGNGVYRINGHWYTDIFIPENVEVQEAEAQESLIGTEIIWYDAAGREQVFTVTEETLIDETPQKVIVPLQVEDNIELRITWEIGVRFSFQNYPSWYLYVDVISGELIRIVQLFVT